MPKTCPQCSSAFEIPKQDLDYYEKVSPLIKGKKEAVPEPTLCPDCRRQRRFSYRNERTLYHRKCDLSGKQIISNFADDAENPVYAYGEWWSDKWDARTYGREFDWNHPLFPQILELQKAVPQLALSVWNSENSDYCNYVGHVKDCYLIFGSVYSQDCYYGSPYYSKNCTDTLLVRECERSYECVDCRKLYECFYCRDCHHCRNLLYCYDLQGSSDCIGCAGLRHKQYCILNKQYSKEEYERQKKKLDLGDPETHEYLRKKLKETSLLIPHRCMQGANSENVSGNYVYQCQNVLDSYYADRSQDCRYCAQVVDLKDCYDNNYTEENELCCDYLGAYQNQRLLFSKFCNRVSDAFYCDTCFNSKNLFGCIGMHNQEYCILNKHYSKEQYESLVPRIIEHMRRTGEWGEFFPVKNSPFGYNETVAQEYFPLSEDRVRRNGWSWREEEKSQDKYLGPDADLSAPIGEIDDSICQKILRCEVTNRPFKIIPQELKFYREMNIPLPRKCPDQRHKERMALRNPRKLWDRDCAECGKPISTSYSPERPEKVVCESCYLKSVY